MISPNPIIPEGAAPYAAQFAPILAKIRAVAEEDEVALVDHEELITSRCRADAKNGLVELPGITMPRGRGLGCFIRPQ